MGRDGFEVLIIRKSGPTHSMKMQGWWITLMLVVVLLFGAALGAGAFMLYRQYWIVAEIAEDTRLLMFRTERLEALVQEQEIKELMISQQTPVNPAVPPQNNVPAASVENPPDEPVTSELVSLRNIRQSVEGSNLEIAFDLINEQGGNDPAIGYIAVIAHGERQGKPWIEAWPPMRLNQQGRPEQYRRGMPFTVQRFRPVLARMAIADKLFERVELVFYSRQGDIIMVQNYPLSSSPAPAVQPGESAADN